MLSNPGHRSAGLLLPHVKDRSRMTTRPHLLRLIAFCLGAWMFVLPQVMVSQVVVKAFSEQGCSVPPLTEEEELEKKEGLTHGSETIEYGSLEVNVEGIGTEVPEVPHSVHREVPVPPPWY